MDTKIDILEREVIYMNAYELLEDRACRDGMEVIQRNFKSDRIKGLYCDGVIAINKSIETTAEKTCVLAEEMGHHETSFGNIINLSDSWNLKQERQARLYGYNDRIGLLGLIRAYEHGCSNQHEIAEYLEITEEFLCEAVECYRDKYGVCTSVDNYTIYFIPNLIIYKKI